MQQNTTKETSAQSISITKARTHAESTAMPSHLSDDVLNTSLPTRTWSEFLGQTSRKLGLGSALLGAGLGLSGIAPSGMEKRAEGGIIVAGADDQIYKDNGVAHSVAGGGNTGYLKMVTDLGTFYSSAVFLNDRKVLTSAHQHNPVFGNVIDLFVGTSPNFNQPELGSLIRITDVIKHPSYTGVAGGGIDLAILTTETAVSGVVTLQIADGRPLHNETIWFSGYGRTGDTIRGYVGQDGFIRAGTSRAREDGNPILGEDPSLYMNAQFRNFPNFPTDLRLANGDSGGGAWNINGEFLGINIGASTPVTGSLSVFLSASAAPVKSFIDAHSSTAVPEPSSLALTIAALGVGGWLARRKSFHKPKLPPK